MLVKYPTSRFESMYSQKVSERLGLQPRVAAVLDQAGASPVSLISYAVLAMAHNQCEVALVTFADNPKSSGRHAYSHSLGPYGAYGWYGVIGGSR